MASVQKIVGKRGTSYRAQFMRNGRRIGKTFPTKKEAERFLAHLTVSDDLSDCLTDINLTTTPLSLAIRQYLDQHTGKDTNIIQRLGWWSERIGDKPVGKVTRQQVKAALSALEADGKAPATLNRYRSALSSVFSWFNDTHDTKHNPAREVKQKTEDNARSRFLTDDELTRLLAAAKASTWDRLHLLVSMAITTGARRSELLGLRWNDVDLKARTAHLSTTKNGTQRVLTLPASLVQELMKFRQVGSACLFPHPSALNAPFRYFDCYWQTCRDEAGIADFHFHDLRHTCASILAKSGASLLEIGQVLGHKSPAMTARYAHLCNGHKQQLTDRVLGAIAL
ncbi:tyrosine-type recombinase/integrase [Aeromonas rivipollensis]